MTETRRAAPELLLSVCVLVVPRRMFTFAPRILHKLVSQAEGLPVEVLALFDNKRRSIGAKRNALCSVSCGRFVAFVDDDDDVADDYVRVLVDAIRQDQCAGCVVFDAEVSRDGRFTGLCRFDSGFEYLNLPHEYRRSPNHICVIRGDIARRTRFADVNFGEDTEWAEQIAPLLRRLPQTRIDRVLYYYNFRGDVSESICSADG